MDSTDPVSGKGSSVQGDSRAFYFVQEGFRLPLETAHFLDLSGEKTIDTSSEWAAAAELSFWRPDLPVSRDHSLFGVESHNYP